ncbi:prolipoprotein diacylglyceryl transferase [Cytophagales bacterium LB-30]|uniref:Phosphatidylglycerol--prolipoprotein diacylglyceryl transferase n=1 Tax=Shiella aurantiaca TaxID=3058365 RepID=A0ABT8F367_9BACT|nr:prolipoprotein diacylglyceryl transferase [Shiella aurantiaca]MDN4164895.1 prolipoprotein diacylglyceryl transferase [Shiella aurantiaca]
MNTLSFIVWSPDPALVHIFGLEIRYYGLLFALGFILSQQIMYYIFKKEGKPEAEVDSLTFYMIIATVIGARLGHVLFYEPDKYLSNPIDILKIWEGGLASHGATIGILLAIWIYSRKKKTSYLWVLDRIVIVVALTGALIRTGNFMNSEIIGKPTDTQNGVVFAHQIERSLQYNTQAIEAVSTNKGSHSAPTPYAPIEVKVTFTQGNQEAAIRNYIEKEIKRLFVQLAQTDEPHIVFSGDDSLNYTLSQSQGKYTATIQLNGIVRHPAQLYEAFSCILLFIGLFLLWNLKREKSPEGMLFGIFLIILFSLRFLYEFLKENQVDFEDSLNFNMGQILSIPLVLAGVFILIRAFNNVGKPLK